LNCPKPADSSSFTLFYAEPEKAPTAEPEGDDDTLKDDDNDEVRFKFYPKVSERNSSARRNVWIQRHRRINSDFNHSTRVGDNWNKYQKEQNPKEAESNNVVMSLGLEKAGRVLLADDVEELEKTLVASQESEEVFIQLHSF
jgi:hypothetical protein